jgi:hypothetical protein
VWLNGEAYQPLLARRRDHLDEAMLHALVGMEMWRDQSVPTVVAALEVSKNPVSDEVRHLDEAGGL